MFPWIFIWAPNISPNFYWWIDSSNESLVKAIQYQKLFHEYVDQLKISSEKITQSVIAVNEAKNKIFELHASHK
jgi:hypothetical protein